MFGSPGLGGLFWSVSAQKARAERLAREVERRLEHVEDWTGDGMKWRPELNLSAASYQPTVRQFFGGAETVSSDGLWCYREKVVMRGKQLATICAGRQGSVMFDGDVRLPVIDYRSSTTADWNRAPFMGLTPMERMTLHSGTRLAAGAVVVAGLGLGHQLIEVAARKKVNRLVLVERSQALVDFILPEVEKYLSRPVDKVIVGNAYEVLPQLEADVALVDIFETYGSNDMEWYNPSTKHYGPAVCPKIKKIWCWGAPAVRDKR